MTLEDEVIELREKLTQLEGRVRLSCVAERFIAGDHEIRSDDFVQFDDDHAAQVHINKHTGKWLYFDRHGHRVEPFRVPPEEGIRRLYTIEEVGEIVAKVNAAKPASP